ncbi:MAG: ACP S-malonyltransferase [Kofleriaceae bacterium]|nr:MAG: ACP S-malonyltransferase [Kofleriaceae bacterium]MBZ0235525.1 ACP S-malonyltransferase [Kofleriaceae bacterium]
MTTALLFPGQGSQRVGMGRDLAHRFDVARRTYEEADDALGFKISTLCFEGPEDDLTLTQYSQPAILTTSMAVFRVLSAEKGLRFDLCAGHSLGEWTALSAAGALAFADAVRLTHQRGLFMQEAVPVGVGSMAALMGLELPQAIELCVAARAEGEPCEPANLNGGGQIVISGHAAAIDRAIAAAKGKGAKRAVKLQVSAPFHCSMMQPAADQLAQALAAVTVSTPRVPVVTNVTAEPTTDAARIKELLVEQVTAPVRWEESVKALAAAGVTRAYELGAGSVLRGLVKRIAETIAVDTIGEPHEVDAFQGT